MILQDFMLSFLPERLFRYMVDGGGGREDEILWGREGGE